MFNWIKPSWSTWSKIGAGESATRVRFSKKRREKCISTSSTSDDPEMSVNLVLEDCFSTASKCSTVFGRGKRFSTRIASVLQRKRKGVRSMKKEERNRSACSLLDEITDKDASPDSGVSLLNEEETKKAKRCRRKTVANIFSLERKKKLFKRKPLDDYAKRKLQISRETKALSGWEGASSSSGSLSSLANEVAAFSTSSPITKTDSQRKQPRVSLNDGNNTVVIRRKTVLFFRPGSKRSSSGASSGSEKNSRALTDDKSSFLSDSSLSATGNTSNSNDIILDQSGNTADLPKNFASSKFTASLDRLTHISTNAKEDCENCALARDAPGNRRKNRSTGFLRKLFSKSIKREEESSLAKVGNSANCISNCTKFASKDLERPASAPADLARFHARQVVTSTNVKRVFSDESTRQDQANESNSSRRTRLQTSRSTEELLDDDSISYSSLNDLPYSCLRHSNSDDCKSFVSQTLNLDEEKATDNVEMQQLSFHLGYEQNTCDSRFYDSLSSSYVITMYV